jgi:hypothetical protein
MFIRIAYALTALFALLVAFGLQPANHNVDEARFIADIFVVIATVAAYKAVKGEANV